MSPESVQRPTSLEHEAREAATDFRATHGLGLAPLGDLVALIDLTQQVDVAILDSGADEHGMTMRDPERGVVMVAAARTRHPMRQRSTLAHELAHIIFGDYAAPRVDTWGQRDPEEIRADNFGRHLLVPIEALLQSPYLESGSRRDLSTLSTLVQQFEASPQIVAIQMREAKLITPDTKAEWMAQSAPALAAKFGWSDQYRASASESDSRRAPQRLLARATTGYLQGSISLAYIARLRGMTVAEVAEEFQELGISPGTGEADDVTEDDVAMLSPPMDADATAFDFATLDALEAKDADEPTG